MVIRKKSLMEAKEKAIRWSKEHPEVKVALMDGRGLRGTYTEYRGWIWRERVLEGWFTVAVYQNGEVIKVC